MSTILITLLHKSHNKTIKKYYNFYFKRFQYNSYDYTFVLLFHSFQWIVFQSLFSSIFLEKHYLRRKHLLSWLIIINSCWFFISNRRLCTCRLNYLNSQTIQSFRIRHCCCCRYMEAILLCFSLKSNFIIFRNWIFLSYKIEAWWMIGIHPIIRLFLSDLFLWFI